MRFAYITELGHGHIDLEVSDGDATFAADHDAWWTFERYIVEAPNFDRAEFRLEQYPRERGQYELMRDDIIAWMQSKYDELSHAGQ